jgi:hypothetical protein
MTFDQLRSLLRSRARAMGLELMVSIRPWPDGGAVQRIGNVLLVTIDSRQSLPDRVEALAHEAGHILFGHYTMDDGVWTLVPPKPGFDDEWEREADYFAMFACRSRVMPAEWIIGEQKKLGV